MICRNVKKTRLTRGLQDVCPKKRYREFPQFIAYGEYQGRPYLIEELLVPKDLPNTSQYLFNSLQQLDLPPIELFNDAAIQQEFQEITKKLK